MRRPLSGFEKAFCLSEPPVPINFSLVACFTGEPDETALRLALRRLHERYAMAALRLEQDAHGAPWFTSDGVPDFPLRVSDQASAGNWRQVAAQELGKGFDLAKGPLIRMVLLRHTASASLNTSAGSADLVLTFHHGIADGISAVYFLRDMLCLLNDSPANLPVMPPPPELLSLVPGAAKRSLPLKAQLLGMKGGLWLMQHFPPLMLRYPPADRLIEGRPPWQHFSLTSRDLAPAQVSRLANRCQEEETSIHAAISTAWLCARLAATPDARNWKGVISSPVNLRGLLHIENTFGMYMSNAVITADCRPERDFWAIARGIKARLHQNIQSGQVYRWVLTMLGMMDASPQAMRKAVPAFATQPVNYDFSISNLGRLSLPVQAGSLALESVYGPIVNTSERELTVGIATAGNRLTMTLTYRDFVLNSVEAERMADKVLDTLAEATGWQTLPAAQS